MSDQQYYDAANGQMPLSWGDTTHLSRAAAVAVLRGDVSRADAAELEFVRRTQEGPIIPGQHTDGDRQERTPGEALRLIRAYGKAGRLAVEWRTIGGIVYTDIDGKEITDDQEETHGTQVLR